jgi:SAM-dependent methyltransferase
MILGRSLKRVCEVGGGANPALPLEFVKAHGLDYTILDISPEELAKAPAGYTRVVADLCSVSPAVEHTETFQLVFSKMLAEHIVDPQAFHRNIWRLLIRDGIAVHFFPTMYAPPFVVNRLLPEALASMILRLVDSRDRQMHRKFAAFYRWCRGPILNQIARFEELDFQVLEYHGFFGHGYYNRIPLLKRAHDRISDLLLRHPLPLLTSYAYVMLQKTHSAATPAVLQR